MRLIMKKSRFIRLVLQITSIQKRITSHTSALLISSKLWIDQHGIISIQQSSNLHRHPVFNLIEINQHPNTSAIDNQLSPKQHNKNVRLLITSNRTPNANPITKTQISIFLHLSLNFLKPSENIVHSATPARPYEQCNRQYYHTHQQKPMTALNNHISTTYANAPY